MSTGGGSEPLGIWFPPSRLGILQRLLSDAEKVLERGEPHVSVLSGTPGLGKSVIAEEVLRRVNERGYGVIRARPSPLPQSAPLAYLIEGLRQFREDHSPPASVPALSATSVGVSEPGPLALVPEGAPGRPGSSPTSAEMWTRLDRLTRNVPEGSPLVPGQRSRFYLELRQTLGQLSRTRPTLLYLPEVDKADEGSQELLALLLEGRPRGPLWVLITMASEADLRPALRRTLQRGYLEGEGMTRYELLRLHDGEMEAMVRHFEKSGTPVPEPAVQEIVRRSRGIPGEASRLYLTWRLNGQLPPVAETPPSPPGGPRPLASLGEVEERAVALLSVIGARAPFRLMVRLLDLDEERCAEVLEDLVLKGLLQEEAGGTYSFRDPGLSSEVYGSLTAARRRLLHLRVAEALESEGSRDHGQVYALAHHFVRSGNIEKGRTYLLQALRASEETHDEEKTLQFLGELLELERSHPENQDDQVRWLVRRGELWGRRERDDEALRDLEEARRLLEPNPRDPALYAECLGELAQLALRGGEAARAQALADQALRTYEQIGHEEGQMLALRLKGLVHLRRREFSEARRYFERVIEIGNRGRVSPQLLGRAYMSLTDVLISESLAQRPQAEAAFDRGFDLLLKAGDRAGAFLAICLRAAAERWMGDEPHSRQSVARALEIARAVPDLFELTDPILRRAAGEVQSTEVHKGLALAQVLRDLAIGMDSLDLQARADLVLAEGWYRQGQREEALAMYREASQLFAIVSRPAKQADALYAAAKILWEQGNRAQASRVFHHAESITKNFVGFPSRSPFRDLLARELEDLHSPTPVPSVREKISSDKNLPQS
jgi:tetratricopeptide (TPR) repeat protein